jgi:AcrR family transcriptional regulator
MTSTAAVPDTRRRLLDVARRRFAEDGALTPTLDELRREAGVSVGALYHHFPDKRALAAAVFAEVLVGYQQEFVAMLRAQATARGGIRGGVAHHLRWVTAHRAEAGLLLGERLDSDALREANRAFFGAIEDWWRPHAGYGVLRPMQPDLIAALWFGPAQEYGRHWLTRDARRIPTATVQALADAAWVSLHTQTTDEEVHQ